MGQKYLGAAVLHHLEGFHVQTLDLGTLMGDSTKVSWVLPFSRAMSLGVPLITVTRSGLGPAVHRGETTPALCAIYPFVDGFRIWLE